MFPSHDPEEQKEMIQKWVLPTLTNPTARKMAKEMKKNGDIVSVYQACQANVAFYKMINGSKGKIVYGSMGWETKDGDAWLEFEHTRMSKTMKRKIIAGIAAAAAAALCIAFMPALPYFLTPAL